MKTRSKESFTLHDSIASQKQLKHIYYQIFEANKISITIEEEREVRDHKEFSTGKRRIIFDIYTKSRDET